MNIGAGLSATQAKEYIMAKAITYRWSGDRTTLMQLRGSDDVLVGQALSIGIQAYKKEFRHYIKKRYVEHNRFYDNYILDIKQEIRRMGEISRAINEACDNALVDEEAARETAARLI